jgi:hypothetical protein
MHIILTNCDTGAAIHYPISVLANAVIVDDAKERAIWSNGIPSYGVRESIETIQDKIRDMEKNYESESVEFKDAIISKYEDLTEDFQNELTGCKKAMSEFKLLVFALIAQSNPHSVFQMNSSEGVILALIWRNKVWGMPVLAEHLGRITWAPEAAQELEWEPLDTAVVWDLILHNQKQAFAARGGA